LRKRNNVTQSELAKNLGIVANQISRYEKGLNDPPIDKILLLVDYFQVDLNDFILADMSKGEKHKDEPPAKGSPTEALYQKIIAQYERELRQVRKAVQTADPELAKKLGLDDD